MPTRRVNIASRSKSFSTSKAALTTLYLGLILNSQEEPMRHTKLLSTVVGLTCISLVVLLGGCSGSGSGSGGSGGVISLQGAGATFPYPLYQKWMSEYGKLNPNIHIDYQTIGSGGGIKQIQAQTVDFGASDAPLIDDE